MEFFVTHQAVDHYSGDCSVAFASKDKSNDNRIIQTYLDLHRFEPKLASTLMLGKVEGYKSKRVLVVGLGESPLTRKDFIKVLKSLSSAMGNSKVKNVVIPFIEVQDADEAWIQTSTARVLKNESYKVDKVGVQEEPSDIALEAVNLYSKNNGASEIQKGVAVANGMVFSFFLLIPWCGVTLSGFVAIVSVIAATLATNKVVNLSNSPQLKNE